MGTLAKSGIQGGQRVPLDRLVTSADPIVAPGTAAKDTAAEDDLANRVLTGEELSRGEIVSLLTRAPLSQLMRYVSAVQGGESAVVLPRPLVLLPLENWLRTSNEQGARETATRFLRALPFAELDIIFDWHDFSVLESFISLAEEVSRRRPGVRFIGPRVEDIIAWLEVGRGPRVPRRGGERSRKVAPSILARLSEVLFAMRKAGFYRLRFATSIEVLERFEVLERLEEAGLTAVVGTPVDAGHFESCADHLRALRAMLDRGRALGVWLPVLVDPTSSKTAKGIQELRLLRALAVGSLYLRSIPVRRASSGYLSMEGLGTARLLGANDLGYGGVDSATVEGVGVLPYHLLLTGFSQ